MIVDGLISDCLDTKHNTLVEETRRECDLLHVCFVFISIENLISVSSLQQNVEELHERMNQAGQMGGLCV